MLPQTIPIFPLPNVVLFPNVFLPLHIFEPRYREMVGDVLRGDRIIGMVLLRPGFEDRYEERPPVYPIGCAGLITHANRLPDGRYNIVLQGLEKFRVIAEDDRRPYRIAHVETLMEQLEDADRTAIREARRRLEALLVPSIDGTTEVKMPAAMSDEDLVNALAQHLELEPLEKQALLERNGLIERSQSLIELLEMRVLAARRPWGSGLH
jgi:Lon protease-like protein